jgi:hypothetical protein
MTIDRHPDADTSLVSVERSDVIDAAAALALMARENRRAAKLRRNAGPGAAAHRAWLRSSADVYEAAASRMQAVADASL